MCWTTSLAIIVPYELTTTWRANEASKTLSGVYIFELVRYIYYKYSTPPPGISINIAPKVGIFPEAESRGKYSLPRVQYYRYSTGKG